MTMMTQFVILKRETYKDAVVTPKYKVIVHGEGMSLGKRTCTSRHKEEVF